MLEQQEAGVDEDEPEIAGEAGQRERRALDHRRDVDAPDQPLDRVLLRQAHELRALANELLEAVLVLRRRGDELVDARVDQRHQQPDRGGDAGDREQHRRPVRDADAEAPRRHDRLLQRDHQIPQHHRNHERLQERLADDQYVDGKRQNPERGTDVEEVQIHAAQVGVRWAQSGPRGEGECTLRAALRLVDCSGGPSPLWRTGAGWGRIVQARAAGSGAARQTGKDNTGGTYD